MDANIFAPTSNDPKTAVMQQVKQETAITNARMLVEKLNEHCFAHCVPTPGPSLSGQETQCFTHCMEKYMQTWNAVSRQYITKLQQQQGGLTGGTMS